MASFFNIENLSIEPHTLFLIAGPCVLDETTVAREIASEVAQMTQKLGIPYIFKASYAKANRTSGHSYRGVGITKGLEELAWIKEQYQIPVLTDVHNEEQAQQAGAVVDVLQVPAFLCRQTSLLESCAKTGKVVNIKKGQFVAPWDMKYAVEKIRLALQDSSVSSRVMLTERGSTFGYGNLVVDMRSFVVMKEFGCPIVFDGTHSVQLPGAGQGETAGQREMIPHLVRSAVAAGCHGLFLEVHPEPEKSPSDRASILPLAQLEDVLQQALAIHKVMSA